MGLQKFSGQKVRRKSSSPNLIALNTALMSAASMYFFEEARRRADFWGRLVESSVGAFLANAIRGVPFELFYWSSRNREVDFVLARGDEIVAIEVKSGRKETTLPGLEAFSREFPIKRSILVGSRGIPLDEFFCFSVEDLFR